MVTSCPLEKIATHSQDACYCVLERESAEKKMAPKVGLEPTTDRLTADCSTIELLWNPKSAWNVRPVFGGVKLPTAKIFAELAAAVSGIRRSS